MHPQIHRRDGEFVVVIELNAEECQFLADCIPATDAARGEYLDAVKALRAAEMEHDS
jgi:hypothetical protein